MADIVGAEVLNDALLQARIWPPECCVPAFLYSAMTAKGVAVPVPDALPNILGVRVGPDQDNPLGLTLADHCCPPGIRAVDAEREINRLFAELQLPLRCRRVPFLEIGLGLWEDVLDAALAKNVVVGIGVDFDVLMQRTTQNKAEHVLRVLAHNGDHLEVVDDSGEFALGSFSVTTDSASRAVLAIPDGFWMIGEEQDLRSPLTSPWGTS